MLILPYTDCPRLDFHQFGKRVDEAAAYRHRSAHSDVFVGKFIARHFRSRVYRRSVLADNKYAHVAVVAQRTEKTLCFAARRSVSESYGVDAVCFYEVGNLLCSHGGFVAWRCGVDHVVVQEVALTVKANHFAAGAVAWVDGKHALVS